MKRFAIGLMLLPAVCVADELHVSTALLTIVKQVEVPARESGVLQSLNVREGKYVKSKDVVAAIDESEAKFANLRARVELENAREQAENDIKVRFAKKASEVAAADYTRAVDANKRRANTHSLALIEEKRLTAEKARLEIEQAEHDLTTAKYVSWASETELRRTQYKLDRHKVLAPINGKVVKIYRQQGEWVEPGQPVMRILHLERLRAEGFVQASDLSVDIEGAKVSFRTSLPTGDVTFPGTIVFVSPEIVPVNGQVRVWAEIANPELILKPGMRGSMTIVLPTGPVPKTQVSAR